MADANDTPNDPFILLLNGVYQPVVNGPNLGLTGVNLNDGSYSMTRIYPVFGVAGRTIDDNLPHKPVGNFFVQFSGSLCAYQLPGGAMAMQFLNMPGSGFKHKSP
jgi:hypothetical protein